MDLVNTVRKEGSRGGRGDFKWTDVQADQHRENYLGHSVMAPVGRWQRGKDLQWYARNKGAEGTENDGLTEEERARKERQEEIARIKLAEREAMNKALGYEIDPDGPLGDKKDGTGANATAVVGDKTVGREEPRFKEKKSKHQHRHPEEPRARHRERSPRNHRHRESRHDGRERSRSRERREDDYRRKRPDTNHKTERKASPDRRRHSRSASSESMKRRAPRKQRDRRESRSPYRQSSSRNPRRHYEDRRQRSRSP